MKKNLLILILLLFSMVAFSQNSDPIKFLGIPIDGTEIQFVTKLKSKGFTYDYLSKSYKGQFNGRDVDVYIHTNHNLVDRVYVSFPSTTEKDIKIEFNKLLAQFKDIGKYMDLSMNEAIPEEDDISYEIMVNNKRYQASFSYYDPSRDKIAFMNALLDKFSDFYTEEQLIKLKEYVKKSVDAPEEQGDALQAEIMAEIQKMGLGRDDNSEPDPAKPLKFLATLVDGMKSLADGEVWFMSHQHYGQYNIGLYYDNLHNQAHGEDL